MKTKFEKIPEKIHETFRLPKRRSTGGSIDKLPVIAGLSCLLTAAMLVLTAIVATGFLCTLSMFAMILDRDLEDENSNGLQSELRKRTPNQLR